MGANRNAQGLLSRSSPDPLYRQLADHLEREIREGSLKRGERLDSEEVLAVRFRVSRITLRQAVAELVRKQLLVRKQGKGTFVTAPVVQHDLKRSHGLLGSLFSQADTASTRLLRYELCVPPTQVATLLNLRSGEQALALDRLYLIDDQPVALGKVWLAPEVGALPRSTAKLMSTEDMMRQVGIVIASTQVAMRAEAAGAACGRVLKISAMAPVLVLRRKSIADDGVVKELCEVWFCSDRYEFVCASRGSIRAENLFDIRAVTEQV